MAQRSSASWPQPLDFNGLAFDVEIVVARGSRGTKYLKRVWSGMPRIPMEFMDSVAYLYGSEADARAGEDSGATGFFVYYPSSKHQYKGHYYFVTNYHTAIQDGFNWLRMNLPKFDGTEVFQFDAADWQFIPGGGDVAAVELDMHFGGVRFRPINVDRFVPKDYWHRVFDVGEDVFMLGRFVDHDGGEINRPAARFGNVSIGPGHVPGLPNSHSKPDYLCIDMHSRTGFSGAPVMMYRTHGTDLSTYNSAAPFPWHQPVVALLGIHCSQFPETMMVAGSEMRGMSGMTVALAPWHILDLLNCEVFAARRAALDQEWGKENPPCPE